MVTPLYKILIVYSFFMGISFGFLLSIVKHKDDLLKTEYDSLEETGFKVFSTLTNYHKLNKNGKAIHSYTYLAPDKHGNMHEITEEVDEARNLSLRIGDTLETKTKTIEIFGKMIVISKIKGNKAPYQSFSFLRALFQVGILFASGLFILSFFYLFAKINK